MKPTVADEMFPEGPPYTDVEDAGETTVYQQVHADFYRGMFSNNISSPDQVLLIFFTYRL